MNTGLDDPTLKRTELNATQLELGFFFFWNPVLGRYITMFE